jgi:hypothetical protein
MPNIFRYSVDELAHVVEKACKLKIPLIALFPYSDSGRKDVKGKEALNKNNLICKALKMIKKNYNEIGIMCDVALDPYTDHGHDGILKNKSVDKSLEDFTKNEKEQIKIERLCGGNSYNFIIPDLLVLEPYWGENVKKLSKSDREKKRSKYDEDEKINEKIIKEYRSELGQCILESEHDVSIKFLEDYIFNRVSDFFKNPELVKTLNYLGDSK